MGSETHSQFIALILLLRKHSASLHPRRLPFLQKSREEVYSKDGKFYLMHSLVTVPTHPYPNSYPAAFPPTTHPTPLSPAHLSTATFRYGYGTVGPLSLVPYWNSDGCLERSPFLRVQEQRERNGSFIPIRLLVQSLPLPKPLRRDPWSSLMKQGAFSPASLALSEGRYLGLPF